MKLHALPMLALVPWLVAAAQESPYAGQQLRDIRSLSGQEIEALQRGDGMGFAKLAELHHFPGPRHVLERANEHELDPQQLADSRSLFERMRRDAIAPGDTIVEAESRLDRGFERGPIDPQVLRAALPEIGRLRAELRYVHLLAHLAQKRILTPVQIRKYDALRGYREAPGKHGEHRHVHDRPAWPCRSFRDSGNRGQSK